MSSTTKPTNTLKSGFTNFKNWSKKKIKDPICWVKFAAYAIPAAFLIYVLYMNFLPFGYHKTFTINVGSATDTKVGEFYLEPSKDLSERKVSTDGTTLYRELNGMANVVFKPKAVLKNASITVSVKGEGVSIIPPQIDFDPSTVKWDYNWDFTKEIPKDLTGNAFMFDGAATFNGKDTRLELPDSADKFEDVPMSIYAEWTPTDSENNTQQIVGHYNWEFLQNRDSINFQVGRMSGTDNWPNIIYPITSDFLNKKHTATLIYNPSENGYIEMIVDGNYINRVYFGQEKIAKDYGKSNLRIGQYSSTSSFFKGSIHTIKITNQVVTLFTQKITMQSQRLSAIGLTATSLKSTLFTKIQLNIDKK